MHPVLCTAAEVFVQTCRGHGDRLEKVKTDEIPH